MSNTTYYLTVTGAGGCQNYDTTELTVNPLPMVVAERDSNLCVDMPVQLQATGAATYVWTPARYLDDDSIANPVATASKNVEYSITGTDLSGCKATDTVTLTVFNVDFASPDTMLCAGENIQLVPIIQGDTNGINYIWTPNIDIDNSTVMSPFVSPMFDRKYILQITNGVGCVDSDSVDVNLFSPAAAEFEFLNSPRCSGSIIETENISENADNFLWYLNGEFVSSEENPKIGIDNLIENRITMIATNDNCSDSTFKIIPAEGLRSLLQLKDANVFTPNNDGINDLFDPGFEGEFIGCVNFQIFDRWGDKVFDSNIGQYGWDGRTLRGRDAPNGIYYYVIKIASEEIKGSVYLNR